MTNKDIDIFLAAKRRETLHRHIDVAAVGVILLFVVALFLGLHIPFSGSIIAGIVVGTLGFNLGNWSKPTTSDLLDVIERNINQNPEAILLLAEKNA